MAPLDDPSLDDIEPFVSPDPNALGVDQPVTPDLATYTAPDTPIVDLGTPEGPGYDAPDDYTPDEKATVQGRMPGLLDSGSKYIEAARQSGIRMAQSRGLLNSSIAASAGEKSAIESAFPIASQDAAAFQEAGMAGYEGEIAGAATKQAYEGEAGSIETQTSGTSILEKQKADTAAALVGYTGAINSGLSAQEAGQKVYQSAYDAAIASGISAQEARQVATLSAQEAAQGYNLQQAELNSKERIAKAERDQLSGWTDPAYTDSDGLFHPAVEHKGTLQTELDSLELRAKDADATQQLAITARSQDIKNELEAREAISKAEIEANKTMQGAAWDSEEKMQFNKLIGVLSDNYSARLTDVWADPVMSTSAKWQLTNNMRMVYEASVELVGLVGGYGFEWGDLAGEPQGDISAGVDVTKTPGGGLPENP